MRKIAKLESKAGRQIDLPSGTPAWITSELAESTIHVWQPYYKRPLLLTDAISMLEAVGRLIGLLRPT